MTFFDKDGRVALDKDEITAFVEGYRARNDIYVIVDSHEMIFEFESKVEMNNVADIYFEMIK